MSLLAAPRRSLRLSKSTVQKDESASVVSQKRRRSDSIIYSDIDREGSSAQFKSLRSRHAKSRPPPTIAPEKPAVSVADISNDDSQHSIPSKRKKITEEPKVEDYPSRIQNEWKIGAHVSSAGGVENAILHAASIGANAFALFLKSQRKWNSKDLSQESINLFKSRLKTFGYESSYILPHGSYLINLGNPDASKREKSYECFLDDLKRCEQLGLELYNFHPGSTTGLTTLEDSIALIAGSINRAHKSTHSVVVLLENMAGAGNTIGSRLSDLASIIEQVSDKSRIGVCLDTCHLFVSGYDIREREAYETIMSQFTTQIGLQYLRGMHLNDSKAEMGSKRDRHQNIGLGTIGLPPFAYILSDPRTQNIPLILETPSFENDAVWKVEIGVLNRLCLCSRDGDSNSNININIDADADADANDDKNHRLNPDTVTTRCTEMTNEICDVVRLAESKKNLGKKVVKVRKITGKKKILNSEEELVEVDDEDEDAEVKVNGNEADDGLDLEEETKEEVVG